MMNAKTGSMAFAFSLLMLAGCAAMAPGNEFGEQQLAPNAFRISYVGQPRMNQREVESRALSHAAELTLENGFKHFVVTDSKSSMQSRTGTVPISVTGVNPTREGMPAASTAATQTRYESYTYQVSVVELEFSMFKEKPEVEAVVHDAKALLATRPEP